jgi:succinate dehydrogenase / fumarate reductase, cytochrome b subunit
MSLDKRVRYMDGLKYQGGGPMLAFILHRLTALGILLFVGLHVVVSFTSQQTGAEWADWLNTIYKSPWFQVFVAFCVLFHAFNGLRIALLDFFPSFQKFQREAIWVEWAIILPMFLLAAFLIIQVSLTGS